MTIPIADDTERRKTDIVLELLREKLAHGTILDCEVHSKSMLPLLEEGDTVSIIKADSHSVHKGDIVVFRIGSALHIHRNIRSVRSSHRRTMLITKGDNLPRADRPAVSPHQLLGKVIVVKKDSGVIDLRRFCWRAINYLIAVISGMQNSLPAYLAFLRNVFLRNRRFDPGIIIRERLVSLCFIPLKLILAVTKKMPLFYGTSYTKK